MVGVVVTCLSWLGIQFLSCWNNFGTLAILLTLLALLLDYMKRRNRDSRLPPGPTPLPFIGNLLLLDRKNPHKTLTYLEKNFGEAVSIQIGWEKFVILNKYKLIKEALIEKPEEFVKHPEVPLLKLIGRTKNCGGIFMATASSGLKEQRKFCISALNHFGKALRNVVSEEAEYLCSEFKSKEGILAFMEYLLIEEQQCGKIKMLHVVTKGLPFNPHNLMLRTTVNVISTLIFNVRFEHKDETFTKLMHATEGILMTITGILPQLLAITGDWMHYIPGPHRKFLKHYADFSAVIKEAIKKHKKTRDPTSPRDFIDMFLDEIEKDKGNTDSSFNEQNLINVILDLFAAGSKTAAHTVLWGLLIMVLHPEIQQRVHEEIDKVIGKERSPRMNDQANLPYTCAVISEIQRYADLVPALIPYMTNRDVQIGKYVIPKDTMAVIHLSSLMKDETMWEKPHEFYPEHFLDTNGQVVKKANFLPFSAGRRSCPGEQLAKMEIFLFFTSLLQQFTFVIPKNFPRPEEKRQYFLIIHAPPFQISAIPR